MNKKKLVGCIISSFFAICVQAANPIIKGVFVDSSTGEYLKGPVYVSKSGSDANGGTSWEDAKLTIQAGVEAANELGDGTTVLVGPGTYSDATVSSDATNTPTVVNIASKKLYLKSSEGKEKTIILGQYGTEIGDCGAGARRCIYAAPAGTVVDGFTLKNGATVKTGSGNDSESCGGGIVAATHGGQQPDKGYVQNPQVWIVNSDILDCRANRGAAFGRGVLAINCYVAGCKSIDSHAIIGYRSYNYYNCIFEGNGAGDGYVLSHSSCSSALNCTFIGNFADTSVGVPDEMHYMYNCALIDNKNENASDATRCFVSNCVTTTTNALYGCADAGCVGGVAKYQLVSPVEGDYAPVAGSALIGAASKDLIAEWGANWVPSDFIDQDFYGNPRPFGEGDSVDVGAVQAGAGASAVNCGFIELAGEGAKVTFGGKTYTGRHAGEYLAIAEHPVEQIRVSVDLPDGATLFGYKMTGLKANLVDQQFSCFFYPDRQDDNGCYLNPPNAECRAVKIEPVFAKGVKWADPQFAGGYAQADGSFEHPFETLQEAVDASSDYGVIIAKPGVYDKGETISPIDQMNDNQDTNSTPNRVYVTKNLRIVSTDGAESTVIKGAKDTSETGAYSGCGPAAVRCVLARQDRNIAIQGFTFVDGATDGDLANRGRWGQWSEDGAGYYVYPDPTFHEDGTHKKGDPQYNSSDHYQRGNFGGGGLRCSNWNQGHEMCVVTDSIFTNCVAYFGGAMYGGRAERCLFVGNSSVTNDPGSVRDSRGIFTFATVVSSIFRDNFSFGWTVAAHHSTGRFSTFAPGQTLGSEYACISDCSDGSSPSVTACCVDPTRGDFRIRQGVTEALRSCPKDEADFVKYSSGDFYGRPILFRDGETCLIGAVQSVAYVLDIGKPEKVGNAGSAAEKTSLDPGESVTVYATATNTHTLKHFKVGDAIIPAEQTGASYTITAPAFDFETYLGEARSFAVQPVYDAQDFYVDAEAGNDGNSGLTEQDAKKTLNAALELALNGDTVHAAEGVYNGNLRKCPVGTLSAVAIVPDGVALVASGAQEKTFIEGKWGTGYSQQNMTFGPDAVRGLYLGVNTKLKGFTIRNCGTHGSEGKSPGIDPDDLTGGAAYGTATTVYEDCFFTNCCARSACAGFEGAGTAIRCKFYWLGTGGSAGVSWNGNFYNCFADRCFDQPFGGSAGKMVNCTIGPDNRIGFTGGLVNTPIASGWTLKNTAILTPAPNSTEQTRSMGTLSHCIVHASQKVRYSTTDWGDTKFIEAVSDARISSDGHPLLGSIAIDAGDNDALEEGKSAGVDLDGCPRIVGEVVDIGCYEAQPPRHLYVDAAKEDDSGDGLSLETAKKTLKGVMEIAKRGDIVHAAAGDYNVGVMTNLTAISTAAKFQDPIVYHGSRVVIPEGVSLVATDGPDVTRIIGADATIDPGPSFAPKYALGVDAVRCVAMMGGTYLEGFTLAGGKTDKSDNRYDDAVGGGILAPPASAANNSARIVNCVISNCAARSGGAVHGGILERCRITACYHGSDGITDHSKLSHCVFHDLSGSIFRNCYGADFCTVDASYPNLRTDPEFDMRDGAYVQNSVLYYSSFGYAWNRSYPITNKYIRSSVFISNPKTVYLDPTTCTDMIITNDRSAIFAAMGSQKLFKGSVAVDVGDMTRLAEIDDGKGDFEFKQRVCNGRVDLGAYEYDWRGDYADYLKSGKVEVAEASPNVVLANDVLTIGPASSLKIRCTAESIMDYAVNFTVSDGVLTVGEQDFSESGSYRIEHPAVGTEVAFHYSGTGTATIAALEDLPLDDGTYTCLVDGVEWTFVVTNGEASIASIPTSTEGDLTIPSMLGGRPVTGVEELAFEGCQQLTSVAISDSACHVAASAFGGCTSLTNISVYGDAENPSYVSVGGILYEWRYDYLWQTGEEGCHLYMAVWPEGLYLDEYDCPEGVVDFDEWNLNMRQVSRLRLPSTFVGMMYGTQYGAAGFGYWPNLQGIDVAVGNPWYYSDDGALYSFKRLWYEMCDDPVRLVFWPRNKQPVQLLDTLQDLDYGAFACSDEIEEIVLSTNMVSIHSGAFEGCSSLKRVILPEGNRIWKFANGVLYSDTTCICLPGCEGDLTVPEGVTSIGSFSECSRLTSVTILSNVTNIKSYAFLDCSNLTNITMKAMTPPALAVPTFPDNVTSICVPTKSIDAYKNADGWRDYADKIIAPGSGTEDDPWAVGDGVTAYIDDSGELFINGTGTVVTTPWSGSAAIVTKLQVEECVKLDLGATVAEFPWLTTVNGLSWEKFFSAANGMVKAAGFSSISVDPTTQTATLSVVVSRADSLDEPMVWTPVSTNDIPVKADTPAGFFIIAPAAQSDTIHSPFPVLK